jgi:hypothetical protein
MCCVLFLCGRIVEQRTDDDFVLFNTLKHLVLQQQLISSDLLALRSGTCPDGLATIRAPEPEIQEEMSPLPTETSFKSSDPVVEPELSECFKTIGHRIRIPARVNHGVLVAEKSESGEMVAAVEAVIERAMGSLLERLEAVQSAVVDLCEARNADRRALEAAVTASTASAAAASAGESGALRDVIWHYKHILDKRSELDRLISLSPLQVNHNSNNAVRGSFHQKVPCQWVSASDHGVEAALPEKPKNLKRAEAPAIDVGGRRLCLEQLVAGLPAGGSSLSSGPARQLAASLAVAAASPAVNTKTSSSHGLGQRTRRRGGNAAPAHPCMPHSVALPLSVAVVKRSDHDLRREAADRGGGRISGSVCPAVNESSVKQVQHNRLELATGRDGIRWKQRFGMHQPEVVTSFSKASLTYTGSSPNLLHSGGSFNSSAARGTEALNAAENFPVVSCHGRFILEKPMLPAAGSEVVWTSRSQAGTTTLLNSNPR